MPIKSSTCYSFFRDPNILLLALIFVSTLACFHLVVKLRNDEVVMNCFLNCRWNCPKMTI